ncbi:hypothetical protein FE257_005095 [Aspergillus nanangensis]|uniref:Uncharacterized protein n=1 Tax=Aspergillus nanangensis TaxID=2582783 RepID=A0AAD4CR45_ASPNN|nr:hypothetical protein FE257_005095 [Aspergillus nanangensis]
MARPKTQKGPIGVVLDFGLKDARARRFWLMQLGVVLSFSFWATFLFHLPTMLWSCSSIAPPMAVSGHVPHANQTLAVSFPDGTDTVDKDHQAMTALLASDIWFALGLMTSVDAFAIVSSFNRALIDDWHYFVALRMMTLGSIISFAVFLTGYKTAESLMWRHPVVVVVVGGTVQILTGTVLDKFHKPPPTSKVNNHPDSLQQYSEVLCNTMGSWKEAILATMVTGGTAIGLTAIVPPQWSTLVPVVAIGFEAIFLRLNKNKVRRTPQYTLCSDPILQGMTCSHWGLQQVALKPRIVLSPWVFLGLILASRTGLDIHLWTVFRPYPEFQWARAHLLFSTRRVAIICLGLLAVETAGIPVVSYIKPMVVPVFYAVSSSGVSVPATYGISCDVVREQDEAKAGGCN